LSVYTEESFPLSYIDTEHTSGPIVGYATELIQAILEHAEIDFETVLGGALFKPLITVKMS